MDFVPMKKLLDHAREHGYAVPSFCVWNADVMYTILEVCERLSAPVILMTGVVEFELMRPLQMARAARAMARDSHVRAALHLDHGDTLESAEACIDAGYTSLMLDLSSRPYRENLDGLRRLVDIAHPLGLTVEGELGAVGRVDDSTGEGHRGSTLTDPDQAADFVRRTDIDCLAVSIGNAHGNYTSLPRLDFDRLEAIHRAVDVPLVLHGGSGTPDDDIRRAISLGIAKVNIASDLMKALRDSLLGHWHAGELLWPPVAQAAAMDAVASVAEAWIRRLGADGIVDSSSRTVVRLPAAPPGDE